jgi:pyruvate/2-oxoglutarate dehydrogenase complex dihydrolipoamide dehydrogenase (E3) component
LVRSGRIHRLVAEAARFGTLTERVTLDWPAVIRRQRDLVAEFQPLPDALRRAGIDVILGEARLSDPHTVAVDGAPLRADKIVIGAGSAPVVPALPGRDLAVTSDDLLFLPQFPRRLVLVGAGVIGLEMAGAFSDLGAAVTVIGSEDEILPGFDRDVGAYARAILEARGVAFHLGASVTQFSGQRGAVTTAFTQKGITREVPADQVCVAVGRRWRPESLGAEHLGLAMGDRGLRVSAHLKTSIGHIYAAGDAAGNAQLTPVAAYEGRLAARNALEGDHLTVDETVVPQTVFTTPEVARVGLTHAAARARGIPCHVARHDMRGASNGRATGEDDGYLSLVFDPDSERLLGVQMVSYAAAELIQLAALAIRLETTAKFLAEQISVHPSHTERFIKITAHEYHETCEIPGVPPGAR